MLILTAARIAKLAALLALFGITLVLNTCSNTEQGDNTARPAQTYHFGGPAW